MGVDGALFEIAKVPNSSKERMAYKKAEDLAKEVKTWAKTYDKAFYDRIVNDEKKFIDILNIDRQKEKPRKDYAKYSDIYPVIAFFYDDVYNAIDKTNLEWNPAMDKETIKEVLAGYSKSIDLSLDEENWFNSLKEYGKAYGFAADKKEWKANKEAFKGHSGDIAEMLRSALTGRKNSPNLYFIIHILGLNKVDERIQEIIKNI